MKTATVASLGAIAMVFILGASYLTFGVARVDWFRSFTTTTMVLTDSGGLADGSPVLLTGIPVGRVTNVDNTTTGVQVRLRIDDTYRIPVASTARIESLSALGEPYVEFVPTTDSGPYLRDGQVIDAHTVRMPTSIPQLARTVTTLLDQLDPSAIASLINTLDQALAKTDTTVPQLARSTDLLAATVLSRTPQIHSLLTDLQTMGGDMSWTGPSMAAAGPLWGLLGTRFDGLTEVIGDFVRHNRNLGQYTDGNGLIPFLNYTSAYLDKIGPDLKTLAPAIAPLVATTTNTVPHIDLSALISQALDATTADGSIPLQIHLK
ncbi:MlaD family protein [Nocardia sp. CA2R105]|uniref:MlaD family protein n=1 Tax=Nocardia coffeae TaxID=2873381 RepID=UPI001CA77C75|nr:MlaD family protein [Nocardia coffeae]MBY8863422.1 MlaD family protein [Nocardia coffeae]